MNSISFDNAYLLLLIIPLVLVFVVPFFIAVRKGNLNGHNVASLALHVLMAVIIAFTAAGTSVVTVMTKTEVYVVADVSRSAEKNLDTVDSYIRKLNGNLPRNSELGIVCFGKDYEILSELGGGIKSVKDSSVDASETNITAALEYTGLLFSEDSIKRIVLITDGRQSDQRNRNALKQAVDALESKNIIVDAIYLDDNISPDAKEVQVTGAEFKRTTYLNHTEKASVSVQSSYNCNYKASLYRDGQLVSEKFDTLSLGFNVLSYDLYTDEVGSYSYEFKIEAEGDESDLNNSYSFTQTVTDSISVLIISEKQSDVNVLTERYGERANVVSYVNDASKPNTTNIPYSVEDLCKYDEIILANANVSKIKNYEMFVKSLDTVVSVFGKSLITIGDTGIQYMEDGDNLSSGTRALKELEDMLPVRFGNNDSDPRLYTIVLDCSHSMMFNYKMIIAKRAATYLVNNLLNDDDYVCIIGFFSEVKMIQTPVLASERKEVVKRIENIETGQGTVIGAGIREAYTVIRNLPYSNKQMMLISDGVNFMAEDSDFEPVSETKRLLSVGVVTSVLDVGRGAATDSATLAAQELLKNIATNGNGDYYEAKNNLSVLEKVIFGEMSTEATEDIVKTNSWVRANKRFDDALENIDTSKDTVSYVSRYVYAKAKASATTVLTVDYKNSGGTIAAPLYSYWKYGNGKVSTFTSGLDGEWLGRMSTDGIDAQLFSNVLETNVPSEKIDYPFVLSVSQEGTFARVEVLPASLHQGTTVQAHVTLPDGEQLNGEFTFDSSVYYYEFALPDTGNYDISVTYLYDTYSYTAQTEFYVPFRDEDDRFATYDAGTLYTMIGNGKVSEDGNLKIVNDEKSVGLYVVELTIPFLFAVVALWVADIIIRKLKWADIKSFFNLGKSSGGKSKKGGKQ